MKSFPFRPVILVITVLITLSPYLKESALDPIMPDWLVSWRNANGLGYFVIMLLLTWGLNVTFWWIIDRSKLTPKLRFTRPEIVLTTLRGTYSLSSESECFTTGSTVSVGMASTLHTTETPIDYFRVHIMASGGGSAIGCMGKIEQIWNEQHQQLLREPIIVPFALACEQDAVNKTILEGSTEPLDLLYISKTNNVCPPLKTGQYPLSVNFNEIFGSFGTYFIDVRVGGPNTVSMCCRLLLGWGEKREDWRFSIVSQKRRIESLRFPKPPIETDNPQ